MKDKIKSFWYMFRQFAEDNVYEQYVAHYRQHHLAEQKMLNEKEYYKKWLNDKWNKINRCC